MTISVRLAKLCFILSLVTLGCSKPPPKLVQVRGTVLYHNKPLNSASVQFVPIDEAKRTDMTANGTTDKEGHFGLSTFPHGGGATPGSYKVTVTVYPGQPEIPSHYTSDDSTPLTVDIPEGGKDNIVLTLTD